MSPRNGAAKGRVAPRRGCVRSQRAVAAARAQEARAAGGKRRGPPVGAVVGRGSYILAILGPRRA